MSELKKFPNNMKLWDSVCETDPSHTKKVTFGRGFTAIDPMTQIRRATEVFGAAGKGWGWEVHPPVFLPTNEVCVLVTLSHSGGEYSVSQYGQASLYLDGAEKKKDTDCMKKATTDGLTKCLSYLGFNADVFLGKFDDNKYVQEMTEKHKEYQPTLAEKYLVNDICHLIKSCSDEQELASLFDEYSSDMAEFDDSLHDTINQTGAEVKAVWAAGNQAQNISYGLGSIESSLFMFEALLKEIYNIKDREKLAVYINRWRHKIAALDCTKLNAAKHMKDGATPSQRIAKLIEFKTEELTKGEDE